MILALKILFTLFIATIVGMYWKAYGTQNFLWMSDMGLFLTLGVIWLESPLLLSISIVSFLGVELLWNIDFLIRLITGNRATGMTDYMFEQRYSLFLRLLSLFHVLLPVLWIGLVISWGYDSHAYIYGVPLIWAILITTYLCTDPVENINWVFAPIALRWKKITSLTWLIIMLIGYPLCISLPTHLLFNYFCKNIEKR